MTNGSSPIRSAWNVNVIMAQNYLICNPDLEKKPGRVKSDRTVFAIIRQIRSVEPQFHDDRVFTGAIIVPPQTPFFEVKFTIKLPRSQI